MSTSNQVPAPDPATTQRPRITVHNEAGGQWVHTATQILKIYYNDNDPMASPVVDGPGAVGQAAVSELRKAVEAARADAQCMTRMEALVRLASGVPTVIVRGLGEGWLRREVDKAEAVVEECG